MLQSTQKFKGKITQKKGTIERYMYLQQSCSRLFPQLNNSFSWCSENICLKFILPQNIWGRSKKPLFSGKHMSCNYTKPLVEYSGGKRPLVQCPFLHIQTEVRHNTFQNQDAEIPWYSSRTNQDAYFHPAYQDERDQCWRQRRNKPNSAVRKMR